MNRSVADPNASLCRRISAHHPRCKLADVRATARKPVAIRDRPVLGTLCKDSLFSAGNRWCLSRVGMDEPSSRWIPDRSRLLHLPVWSASPRMRHHSFSFWPAPFIVSVDQRFIKKKIDLVTYLHCCNSLNSWSTFNIIINCGNRYVRIFCTCSIKLLLPSSSYTDQTPQVFFLFFSLGR